MWFPRRIAAPDAPPLEGYASALLVDVILRKTMTLREAPRIDDVLPGEILLPTLAGIGAAGGSAPRHVLDFGGGAGLHYLVAKQAFPSLPLRWAVVDTPEMARAAAPLANAELRFFADVEGAAAWLERIDLIHSVSALQYVPDPEATLARLVSLQAPAVIWAKLMLGDERAVFVQTSRLADNGPGPLPAGIADRMVTCRATRVARRDFLAAHARAGYRLAWKARDTEAFLFLRG